MATRNIDIALRLHYGQFYNGMRRAAYETHRFGSEVDATNARSQASMQAVGRAGLLAGSLMLAGVAVSARAAMQFESAWAGVRKTVEGTEPQMDRLRQGIRDMATEIPASATEIAGVAEQAGQLGIRTDDIMGFSRVMIDLGNSTNLSSEEASTALARLANITQMPQDQFSRLGSTMVDLGNKFATTESEIARMSVRIAGAGHLVGMSEADILGFASALSSVGIFAEAGGTAISRVFIAMENAVQAGGVELDAFAGIAGKSKKEFTELWNTDSAQGVLAFIQGLQRMREAGVNLFPILDNLKMGNVRIRDSILRLVGAGDLLERNLDTAKVAWQEDVALQTEAERRYATTASRLTVAKNNLTDLAISLGNTFLPAIAGAADGMSGFLNLLEAVPGPIKSGIAVAVLLTGAVLTLGGAYMIVSPMFASAATAMSTATAAMGAHAAAWTSFGGVAASGRAALNGLVSSITSTKGQLIGVAAVLMATMQAFNESSAAARQLRQDMASAIDRSSMQSWSEGIQGIQDRIDSIQDQQRGENVFSSLARTVGDMVIPFHDFGNTALDASQAIKELRSEMGLQEADLELVNRRVQMMTTYYGMSEEAILRVADAYNIDLTGSDFTSIAGEMREAVGAIRSGTPATDAMTGALVDLGDETSNATDQLSAYKAMIDAISGNAMDSYNSQTRFAGSVQDLSDSIKENMSDFSEWTEEGRANRDAFTGAAQAAMDHSNAIAEETGNIDLANFALIDHVNKLREIMAQSGLTQTEIDDLFTTIGLGPDDISILLGLSDPTGARAQLDDLQGQLGAIDSIDPQVNVTAVISEDMLALVEAALSGNFAGEGGVVPFTQEQLDGLNSYLLENQGTGKSEFAASVDLDTSKADEKMGKLWVKFNTIQSHTSTSTVDADAEPAAMEIEHARKLGQKYAMMEFQSALTADRRPASSSISSANSEASGRWGAKQFSASLEAHVGGSVGAAVGAALSQITAGIGDGDGFSGPLAQSIKEGYKAADGYGGTGFGYIPLADAKFNQIAGKNLGPVDYSDGTVDEIIGFAERTIPGRYSISSTFRKGAITSTGNSSYHSKNRAVDFGGDLWTVFKTFKGIQGSLKELIFTPAGSDQVKNGANHVYTGGTIQKDHYDHVHVALETGGVIQPHRRRGGMVTDRPRVLVGEGRDGWPEFVIPTDPKYRKNALGLFDDLAGKLGRPFEHAQMQGLKMGGVIGGHGARHTGNMTNISIGRLMVQASTRQAAKEGAKVLVSTLNRLASENS